MRKSAAVCLLATALATVADLAFADEKLACVAAADAAQQQRSAGKLRQARASLHICAREVCPTIVKSDCTQWLAEVEASVPTIVLRALDSRNQELGDVRVDLDGQRIADKLDGLPIEIDPGPHVITCERAGSKKLRQEIVIRTGDRNRTISLLLEDLESPVIDVPPPRPVPPVPGQISPAAWVFAGVAVAAGGTGTYFGLRALSDRNAARIDCPHSCSEARLDSIRTKINVADISFGAAIISGGIATYLFLTPSRPRATSVPDREVVVAPLFGGGAAASWTERF